MGLAERDYSRAMSEGGNPFGGGLRMASVNTWLILVNVGVFVLDALLARTGLVYVIPLTQIVNGVPIPRRIPFPPLEGIGHFSALMALQHFQIWRFITFQFLHASLGHLFGNMLALYFFGPIVESYLGSRRYLWFYLVCGIGGPIAYLLMMVAHVLPDHAWTPLVGASAGIFGVLIAAAQIAPDVTVMLLFPPIPMKLRTLAWGFIAIAVFVVLTGGNDPRSNAGGQAAHLGGAVLGYLLIRNPHWLTFSRKPRMRYRM